MIEKLQDLLESLATEKRLTRAIVPLNGEDPAVYGIRFVGYDEKGHEVWSNSLGTVLLPAGVREETDKEFRERVLKEIG